MREVCSFKYKDTQVTVYRCTNSDDSRFVHVHEYKGPMSHGSFNYFEGEPELDLDDLHLMLAVQKHLIERDEWLRSIV